MSIDRDLAAVILAGGASTRMGSPKGLQEIQGECLLRRVARAALDADFRWVYVVVGAHAEALRLAVADLSVNVVENRHWEEGLASSIRTGVGHLPKEASGVVLLTCDQPAVDAVLLERLIAAEPHEAPAACRYADTLGVPARFPRSLFGILEDLHGDQGAKHVLAHRRDVVPVDFPDGAVDLDTPQEVLAYRNR